MNWFTLWSRYIGNFAHIGTNTCFQENYFHVEQVLKGFHSYILLPFFRYFFGGALHSCLSETDFAFMSNKCSTLSCKGIAQNDVTSWKGLVQWEFQDPKMEVLYHIMPYFCGDIPLHRPYIGLIHGRDLKFRFLTLPLIGFVLGMLYSRRGKKPHKAYWRVWKKMSEAMLELVCWFYLTHWVSLAFFWLGSRVLFGV